MSKKRIAEKRGRRHAKRKEKARALAKSLGDRAQAHAAAKHATRMSRLAEKKAGEARKQEENEALLTKRAVLTWQFLSQVRAIEGVAAQTKFLNDYYELDKGPDYERDWKRLEEETDPEDVLELLIGEILKAEPEGSSLSDVLSNTDLHWHQLLDAVRASPYAHYIDLMLPLVEACGYPLTAEECEKQRRASDENLN